MHCNVFMGSPSHTILMLKIKIYQNNCVYIHIYSDLLVLNDELLYIQNSCIQVRSVPKITIFNTACKKPMYNRLSKLGKTTSLKLNKRIQMV